MTMGSTAFTDSYNSSKGAYNAATANKNGSIASNGNIVLNNTAKVKGNAMYGTNGTITIATSRGSPAHHPGPPSRASPCLRLIPTWAT
jgi:hypothetical protein